MIRFLNQWVWNQNKSKKNRSKKQKTIFDSFAYKRSSPIYFADGLKGHLLMYHGMADQNVHFQDIVKVTQRLIGLGKNNWELAPYPMENHDFEDPLSWTDEYKRIYKLFKRSFEEVGMGYSKGRNLEDFC